MSEQTDLYRFYDADDRLLYVGISFSAVARAAQHRNDKGWWSDVARMEVEHLPTRAQAQAAELDAIRSEQPAYNVVGVNGGEQRRQTSARSNARPPAPFNALDIVSAAGYDGVRSMQSAINDVAVRLDQGEGLRGGRGEFVDSVERIARSVVYGDWCDPCASDANAGADPTHWPVRLEVNGAGGVTAHYVCAKHRVRWVTGWAPGLAVLP